MNIYKVDFTLMWPVPLGLLIIANTKKQAVNIAIKTVTHTKIISVERIDQDEAKVIFYESGDY